MRIGLIADLHANEPAAKRVFSKLDSMGVDQIICAGDVVGYYPFPDETVQFLNRRHIPTVLGNHDDALVNDTGENFSIQAKRALDWTRRNISTDSINFLRDLPELATFEFDGLEVIMTHGSPANPLTEYIFPNDISVDQVNSWFDNGPDYLIVGHTHVPFKRTIGDLQIINPGSVGQPRDRDNRSSFAVLDTESNETKHFRVAYDIDKTADKTKEFLPIQLAERLYDGK